MSTVELLTCDKLLASSKRIIEESQFRVECLVNDLDRDSSVKIQNLEFYVNEIATHKTNLVNECKLLKPYETRIDRTIMSLKYPKDVSTKCLQLRKFSKDHSDDSVNKELMKEITTLDDTHELLTNLVNEIKEQMRRIRSLLYSLEEEVQKRELALSFEKQSTNKIAVHDNILKDDNGRSKTEVYNAANWEAKIENLLVQIREQIKRSRKLRLRVEELLKQKIEILKTQFENCNDAFQDTIDHMKSKKESLELEHSQINEKILEMNKRKQETMQEVTENQMRDKFASRLDFKLRTNLPNVKTIGEQRNLLKQLNNFNQTFADLMVQIGCIDDHTRQLLAKSKKVDDEIKQVTNGIRIDEVECLTERSTVHFHLY